MNNDNSYELKFQPQEMKNPTKVGFFYLTFFILSILPSNLFQPKKYKNEKNYLNGHIGRPSNSFYGLSGKKT